MFKQSVEDMGCDEAAATFMVLEKCGVYVSGLACKKYTGHGEIEMK